VRVASLASTQVLDELSILSGGTLDLLNHAVLVNNGSEGSWTGSAYNGLAGLVAQGRNGGNWGGAGITSSVSASEVGYTAVGIARAGTVPGNTADPDSILLRYTYAGDANLDGRINILDYTQIDQALAANLNGWINGDFNYDGKINIEDYVIIDSNLSAQGDPL
jgi:hypothetical protein